MLLEHLHIDIIQHCKENYLQLLSIYHKGKTPRNGEKKQLVLMVVSSSGPPGNKKELNVIIY